ncbi:MAG: arabinose isomerase [Acidobacteriota bacterium]|nr:arabinose isomerase [Acidobacteriota bacterium]
MAEGGTLRVGLFGIGLEAYWSQFEGLEARLKGYVEQVAERLAGSGREIVNFGLVDSVARAFAVGHQARRDDVDLLVLYVTTYALSSTVLPVVRRAKVPVLVLNLQPEAAIDYARFNSLPDRTAMTGDWLAFCSACSVPEIANVFARAGVPFHQVTGVLDGDPECWREIEDWMAAAQVVETLSHLRLGLMGHYYGGMLDIATDLTAVSAVFGAHIEQLEIDELGALRSEVSDAAVADKLQEFQAAFDVQPDCPADELARAARTAVALDELVRRHALGALAYFYSGTGCAMNEDTITSIILGTSMLTRRGVPVAGEYEVKNALAMKIMDALGAGGSFTEYYGVDFRDDVVLMGHDGPGHSGIAEGKTKVKPLAVYHGKVGGGLSVEMSVKNGPVTLLSVAESGRGFKLLVAEGHSEAGPILEIGNTNSRYRFPIGARGFIQRWNEQAPAHHCAVGLGHMRNRIDKLGKLLGIEVVRVC